MPERWRTGRSVGRTIYRMVGEVASKDDVLIGVMDTPQLAVKVVASVTSCEHVTAERDALQAAIHQVFDCWADPFGNWTAAQAEAARAQKAQMLQRLVAALDTPGTPKMRAVSVESPGNDGFRYEPVNAPDHVDSHGRSWDPHPFVKSSRVGDNVAVCVCGQSPEHQIHAPETSGDAE